MSTVPILVASVKNADVLDRAVEDYRALIKDDAGKTLTKATRLTTISMGKLFHEQPPRPRAGEISNEARARGFRVNPQSRSYLTGRKSADKILGANKSGYFRISTVNGVTRADPVLLGAKGRILAAGKKGQGAVLLTDRAQLVEGRTRDLAAYRKLLTSARRSKNFEARRARVRGALDANRIPDGAVQLNRGSLAIARAVALREKAARGGYLAAEFLTGKRVRGPGVVEFKTRDSKLAGAVEIKADPENDAIQGRISGFLEGAAKIADRENIISRGLELTAKTFRDDMIERLNRRAAHTLGGVR